MIRLLFDEEKRVTTKMQIPEPLSDGQLLSSMSFLAGEFYYLHVIRSFVVKVKQGSIGFVKRKQKFTSLHSLWSRKPTSGIRSEFQRNSICQKAAGILVKDHGGNMCRVGFKPGAAAAIVIIGNGAVVFSFKRKIPGRLFWLLLLLIVRFVAGRQGKKETELKIKCNA
jgi:hypothetical protein